MKLKEVKLKHLIVGFVLVGVLMALATGCTSQQKRTLKDTKSNFTGGLDRQIKVYSSNGTLIEEYIGKTDIDSDTSKVKFSIKGKRVIIYGLPDGSTIVTEEK